MSELLFKFGRNRDSVIEVSDDGKSWRPPPPQFFTVLQLYTDGSPIKVPEGHPGCAVMWNNDHLIKHWPG